MGHHRQNSFDLEAAFTWFLHNFEIQISGKYYILDFHQSISKKTFIVLVLFPARGSQNDLRSVVHTVSHLLEPEHTEVDKMRYAIFGQYYVSWPNPVHAHL